jgi:NAD(P)-dependent dehydrogenase (short-subunit alcohol dehydrogenase family)
MKTLIIGATGTIGKEIERLSKARGDSVISASRKSDPSINIEDFKSLEDYFKDAPELDAVICVAGNASFGKLADLNDDQIKIGLNSKLLGQINLVRKAMRKLKPGGRILLTGGMLAFSPWPETSNIAMANAGLDGFVRAASLELNENKRVAIVHPPLVQETAKAMGMDSSPWPSALKVAETYLEALSDQSRENSYFVKGYEPV